MFNTIKMKNLSTYFLLPVASLQGQGQDMPCTAGTDYRLGIKSEEDFG